MFFATLSSVSYPSFRPKISPPEAKKLASDRRERAALLPTTQRAHLDKSLRDLFVRSAIRQTLPSAARDPLHGLLTSSLLQ